MTKEEEIKYKLAVYLPYLQLMTSLDPTERGIINQGVKNSLLEAWDFLKTANAKELINKGPKFIISLKKLVEQYKKFAKPKVPLEKISEEFNDLCSKNKEIYSYGLEYGWLQEVMDCSNMAFPKDLPFHARIGLGHHAGFGSVEEEFLLRDAFFMLVLSEEAYKNMHVYAKYWKESNKPVGPKLANRVLGTANQNVATYSRLCILSFFSFVEAFVNSVGYDFSLRNKDILAPEEMKILHGRKKGRYLSLKDKIEKFPSITRPDKKTPIILSDPKQIKEPFKTFIEGIKEIRDSSVHYSPKKEDIWRKPDDWIDKAKSTSKLCLEVSLEFWKACYPDRKEPQYLNELDYSKHIDIARKGLKLRDKIKNNGNSDV
jgi:hypothetical protein